jgi:hypothetical protein
MKPAFPGFAVQKSAKLQSLKPSIKFLSGNPRVRGDQDKNVLTIETGGIEHPTDRLDIPVQPPD